jgi:hypothetical protein
VFHQDPYDDWSSHPSGHSAWVFNGLDDFEAGVTWFFATTPLDERLIFVSDDPVGRQWPERLIGSGRLAIASTSDVYGAERLVEPVRQLATFTSLLDHARADGYRGITVAGDSTSLVLTPERYRAW